MRFRSTLGHAIPVAAIVAVLALFAQPALAAEVRFDKEVEAKASKEAPAPGAIKSEPGPNDPAAKVAAPAAKGGPEAKGPYCFALLDNYTQWYIDYFVDGMYQGTVPPYGELMGTALAGPTLLFGRARFVDGSELTWGPSRIQCDGNYRWKLNP